MTTSTFYPAAGTNSPCNGYTGRFIGSGNEAFTTIRNGAGNQTATDPDGTVAAAITLNAEADLNTYYLMRRSIYGFDTSSIPDTDTITSATFSLKSTADAATDALSQSIVIDRRVPASTSALANGDYLHSGWDLVEQSTTRITFTNFMNGSATYKDFPLNATGIGNISKTGLSWFGIRGSSDFDNSAPSWSSNVTSQILAYYASSAGTGNDPKLVVEHGTVVAGGSSQGGLMSLMGVGS